jgi:hypothetical protein
VRTILLSTSLLLLVSAPRTDAEIRVINVHSGASVTLVSDARANLVRWTDDGAALLVGRQAGIVRVGLDRGVTAQPQLDGAYAVRAGGRTVSA